MEMTITLTEPEPVYFEPTAALRWNNGRLEQMFKCISGGPYEWRLVPVEVLDGKGQSKDLTPRELELLRDMVEGLSNKEIGIKHGIAEQTVKVHRKAMYPKLGARNGMHAVAIAVRRGIV